MQEELAQAGKKNGRYGQRNEKKKGTQLRSIGKKHDSHGQTTSAGKNWLRPVKSIRQKIQVERKEGL